MGKRIHGETLIIMAIVIGLMMWLVLLLVNCFE